MIPVSALPQARPTAADRPQAVARPLQIPAPRPPSDRAAHVETAPGVPIPSPRLPTDVAGPGRAAGSGKPAGPGRHRAVAVPMSRSDRAWLLLGHAGSLATLAALLVMSAAVAGALDGAEPTGSAAQVATTTLR